MPKKILISVGGTGGHIYPAVALARDIALLDPSVEILFIGGHLEKNPYFQKLNLPFHGICCGHFSSRNPLKLFTSLNANIKGLYESTKVIRRYQPDLIVGFGSYHSLPSMAAAQICRIPIVLFASDTHPGKVIRLFSGAAKFTAVQFEEAAHWLRGTARLVNMPLRNRLRIDSCLKSEALEYYNLCAALKTVLIFGGSQGAVAINKNVAEMIRKQGHTWVNGVQFVHFTGKNENIHELTEVYREAGMRACVKPFEERMDLAWSLADLVISRAGAASIAEQIEFEVPGILIPYLFAADNHQEKNALFMKKKGAVEVISEKLLSGDNLSVILSELFNHKLESMKSALLSYKQSRPHESLASLILNTV